MKSMDRLGYHNDPTLKARLIGHVEKHRKQDSLLRGTYGKMSGALFRGCAVGCSIRSLDEIEGKPLKLENGNHTDLADRIGIPLVLARLEDRIFEGLPFKEAMLWPTLFYRAIPVGADLSLVWPKFAHWLLADGAAGVVRFAKTDRTRDAINGVAVLLQRQGAGEVVTPQEWQRARSDAHAHAAAAADVYAAAAADVYAAAAAAAAAYAAAAADADAHAAAAADAYAAAAAAAIRESARQKHYVVMAEALLRFMSSAPIAVAHEVMP